MLLVGVACVAWPQLRPFACMKAIPIKGNVRGSEKTYVWHSGLAITVTQFPGEWPSLRRNTSVDVEELEELQAEAMREDAEEQARADSAAKAR